MTYTDFTQKLTELNACSDAKKWAEGKSWQEVYNTCHRGDWLCWLFKRTNPDDIQLLTLVKGHQANTVRHLMKDERSIKAVDAAIAFGEGKITINELDAVAAAAVAAAAYSAYAAAAYSYAAAAYSAYAAAAYADTAAAAYADTDTAAAAYADTAAAYADTAYVAYADADARKENKQLTADIFRKFITIDKFNL